MTVISSMALRDICSEIKINIGNTCCSLLSLISLPGLFCLFVFAFCFYADVILNLYV